jgi:hypothetical protein
MLIYIINMTRRMFTTNFIQEMFSFNEYGGK